jgi:hypothetical protein
LNPYLSDAALVSFSALGDLTRAGVIQFDAASQRITANAEASVMTRNLIRFPTMERLVRIPAQCSIQEVLPHSNLKIAL